MSDENSDLEPLSKLRESSQADSTNIALADAFKQLYPDEALPPGDEAGWARLENPVLAISRRRRAIDGLRVWFKSLGWGWRLLATTGVAALLSLPLVLSKFLPRTERLPRFEVVAAQRTSTELSLISGVRLELQGGRAEVDQAELERPHVLLLEGQMVSQVPRLPKGSTFVVGTEDCDVTVHGTRFLVVKLEGRTRVRVEEGVVEVAPRFGEPQAHVLHAGDELVVPGRAMVIAELSEQVKRDVAEVRCEGTGPELTRYLSLHEPDADLSGAQYLLGLCAASRADLPSAVPMFQLAAESTTDLLRADNALARAAQLSTSMGSGLGLQAWRRYVERFPAGLHHELAERELRRLDGVLP